MKACSVFVLLLISMSLLVGCAGRVPGAKLITADEMVDLVMQEKVPISHLVRPTIDEGLARIPIAAGSGTTTEMGPNITGPSTCIIQLEGKFYLVHDIASFSTWAQAK